jgi:hypothetical protein
MSNGKIKLYKCQKCTNFLLRIEFRNVLFICRLSFLTRSGVEKPRIKIPTWSKPHLGNDLTDSLLREASADSSSPYPRSNMYQVNLGPRHVRKRARRGRSPTLLEFVIFNIARIVLPPSMSATSIAKCACDFASCPLFNRGMRAWLKLNYPRLLSGGIEARSRLVLLPHTSAMTMRLRRSLLRAVTY